MTAGRATVKLSEIVAEFDERLGRRPEPEILTLTEKQGFVSQRERFTKRLAIIDTSDYKLIGVHDIAFNPYLLWAGAIAQNTSWQAAIISPLYPTFRVRRGYDPRFVDCLLNASSTRARYDCISFGSVPRKRRAAVKDFLDLLVPQPPPLAEQKKIARILDRADALRAKRRAALAQLGTLVQAIFIDSFGDPATNPCRWPTVKLRDALAMGLRNGVSPSHAGRVHAKVLTLSAITGTGFDPSAWKVGAFQSAPPEDQSVRSLDFLICRGSGSLHLVGKGHFPSSCMPDVTFPDTIIAARLLPQGIDRAYFQHAWNSFGVRRQIESVARTTNGTFKVNQTMLEGVTIARPPISLQREFSRRVAAIENLKTTHGASLVALDALFASLQHRAFRGAL